MLNGRRCARTPPAPAVRVRSHIRRSGGEADGKGWNHHLLRVGVRWLFVNPQNPVLDNGAPCRQRGAGLFEGRQTLPTMLLIDDEPELSRLIAYAGEAAGYAPTATSDAEAFRRHYEVAGADLIAIDLGMPREDGVELLRFLAEKGCTAPILIVSGFDRRVLETATRLGEALGLNMVGLVEKPIRLDPLEELLRGLREAAG